MSEKFDKNPSDDEFFDAETEVVAGVTEPKFESDINNEEVINELIKKHTGLELSDKLEDIVKAKQNEQSKLNAEKDIDADEDDEDGTAKVEDDDDKDDAAKTEEDVFLTDELVDEDAMRAIEKDMTEEELQTNKEKAEELKLEGNELFKDDKPQEAVDVYTLALRTCPTKYTKERAILYGNRAAAKIKLDAKKSAIEDCSKSLELWPEYVRVLVRRAKLYEHEDKLEEALEDYKKICELDPSHKESRDAVYRLTPIVQERMEKMKTEMMGKLKDLGNMFLRPFGLSTDNFKMQQDPNSGGYSINFNQS